MTTHPARQPQGITAGGQFAATTHPEPEVRLAGGGGHLLAHEKYLEEEEELRLADDPQIIEMEAELPPYTDTSTWEFTRGAQIEAERRGIRFESVSGPAAGSAGSRHARTISETRFPWITWHPPENPKGPFPIPSGKGSFCWLQMCLDDGIGQGQHERTCWRSPESWRLIMARGSLENSFWTQQFPKLAGEAAILGGVLCVLAAALHSLEPAGCIGLDCDLGSLRSATGVVPLAASASTVLLLIGVAGLTMLARRSGRHTRMATAGLICTAVGFALLSAGGLIQAFAFDGNFPGMAFFVFPALLAIFVGLILIEIAVLRSNVLPRWLAVFFILSTVSLVMFNEQAVTVLLAIPFGLAMVAAGYLMWTGATGYAAAPAKGRKGVGGLA